MAVLERVEYFRLLEALQIAELAYCLVIIIVHPIEQRRPEPSDNFM